MTKIYENIYRAVNIGFVNEMKKISFKMNLDIDEIIAAAKTKPFGFKAFYPGPGLGGIVYLLIHFICHGKQNNRVLKQNLLTWQVRLIDQCLIGLLNNLFRA